MAGQQLARDEAGNVWEVDANGQPIRLHTPTPASRPGGVFSLPPDSLTAQGQQSTIGHTQAETVGQGLKNTVTERTLPATVRQAEGEAAKAELGGRGLDPTVREKAIAQYNSALMVDQAIAEMRNRFPQGPGSTSGIAGLEDYFPLPGNKRFDSAGNAIRGITRNALGMTGGENNTAAEAAMNIGPFVPQSSDYDGVILDKISRLERIRDNARRQAIMTLGGIPDQNGNIIPVAEARRRNDPALAAIGGATPPSQPPSINIGPGSGGPGTPPVNINQLRPDAGPGQGPGSSSIETGSTEHFSTVQDRAYQAALQTAFNQGATHAQMDALAQKFGYPSFPTGKAPKGGSATLDDAIAYRDGGGHGAGITLPQTGSRPISLGQQLNNNFADTDVGTGMIHAGLAVGALPNGATRLAGRALGFNGDMRQVFGNPEQNSAVMNYLDAQHPKSALTGDIVGGLAGAGGAEALAAKGLTRLGLNESTRATLAPILGDTTFGGLQGAGSAQQGDELQGALVGGLAGLGGGMFGRKVANSVGSAAQGVRDESVRYLADKGVPLTFGQAVGRSGRAGAMVKGIEDRLTGLPIVGDMVSARRADGNAAYNRAGFSEALAPIGGQTSAIGEAGIDQGRALAGDAYSNTLDGVHFNIDPQFTADLNGARTLGSLIPGREADFNYTLDQKVLPNISDDGAISGKGYQAARQALRNDGRSLRAQPRGNDLNDAFGLVGRAFDGLADRQAPGVSAGLSSANDAYRNLSVLAKAVEAAKGTEGVYSPAQLAMAGVQNARKYGGALAGASEDRPFFNLARHGQNVLPSKVGDSGTAGRIAMGSLLSAPSALLGGGAGYASGDASTGAEVAGGVGVGTLAALAAGGNKTAQRLLVATVLNRPDAMIAGGKAIKRAAPYAGMFGAGAAPSLLGSQ